MGNEPDIRTQDRATPAEYARAYHLAYTAIKAGNATATVVAGNISQVTPLRLRYLDAVRTAYRLQFGAVMSGSAPMRRSTPPATSSTPRARPPTIMASYAAFLADEQ
mgnify:CR=1 FL=1